MYNVGTKINGVLHCYFGKKEKFRYVADNVKQYSVPFYFIWSIQDYEAIQYLSEKAFVKKRTILFSYLELISENIACG